MGRLVFAIPGDLSARTGGYGYARRILAELPQFGVDAVHLPLPGRFPDAGPQDVALALAAMRAALRPGDRLLVDGLAYGVLPPDAMKEILAAPAVALCHHPLCLEAGLTPERSRALRDSERAALAQADGVIVASAHTGEILRRDFGVAPDRITVAPPGTDPARRARGSGGTLALIAVGAVTPRKAHHMLIEALSDLAALDWRLRIVGSRDYAPATANALAAQITALDFSTRVEICGELSGDELDKAYSDSDIFVSSSLFEGFGMALAEAMARGLPIVTTTAGATAETVPEGAALKIAHSDIRALRDALKKIIVDAGLRRDLAEGSWRAGQALPRWRDSAGRIAGIFR